jgi:hypothetical protein
MALKPLLYAVESFTSSSARSTALGSLALQDWNDMAAVIGRVDAFDADDSIRKQAREIIARHQASCVARGHWWLEPIPISLKRSFMKQSVEELPLNYCLDLNGDGAANLIAKLEIQTLTHNYEQQNRPQGVRVFRAPARGFVFLLSRRAFDLLSESAKANTYPCDPPDDLTGFEPVQFD